jgi:hypothetical protein
MAILADMKIRLCESGFIPAGLFSITLWYKKKELSARFAWFFIGNMLAQASTGLIAYGMYAHSLHGFVTQN